MSELLQKQQMFTVLVSRLILFAKTRGYDLTFGEAYRTPEQAALNAKNGTGISNSLHTKRLAIDFNLFKDGKWLDKSEDFKFLGEFWKSLDPECCWGGNFKDAAGKPKPDGNHFSLSYMGVK